MGRSERVGEGCRQVKARLNKPPTAAQIRQLARLAGFLSLRVGDSADVLYRFLERLTAAIEEPWPIVRNMLTDKRVNFGRQVKLLTDMTEGLARSRR